MRSLSGFIMAMFLLFLSTPTIVGLIENSSDTTAFFSMTEEEISHKQLKSEFLVEDGLVFIRISTENKGAISSAQNLRHDSLAATIVIPPPELI